MTTKGPKEIYGGPYAAEAKAINAEAEKEEPDFDGLISGWKTITYGALQHIETLKNPEPAYVGPFSANFKEAEEAKPETADSKKSADVDLDKL